MPLYVDARSIKHKKESPYIADNMRDVSASVARFSYEQRGFAYDSTESYSVYKIERLCTAKSIRY